jgi:hypothetical protein
MSTPPIPSPAPPTKLQNILSIINLVLQGLSGIAPLLGPAGLPVAAGIKLEQVFQGILTNALNAYQQETGLPIDLNKIPPEAQL